jgi:uncharacterized Zn finger protein (UPF0148 family)
MQDIARMYPHVRRRNHMHRIRTTRALNAMGIKHMFPADFFLRHWRDQQNYLEQILHLDYCPRCKLPVRELTGAICPTCSDRNNRAWQELREYRERLIEASMVDQPLIPQDVIDIFRSKEAEDKGMPQEEHEMSHPTKTSVADILAKLRKQS